MMRMMMEKNEHRVVKYGEFTRKNMKKMEMYEIWIIHKKEYEITEMYEIV